MSFAIKKATRAISGQIHCRQLHLVHEIFTKHPNGKLAACEKQKLDIQPKPFRILKQSGFVTVNSVKEALEHIEPMTHLSKVDGDETYRILKLKPPRPTLDKQSGGIKERPGSRVGNAREIHLKTNAKSSYLAHILSKAYQVLSFQNIDFRRVEFHVTLEKDFGIEWILENCPHLRPEMILAAMPPETIVLAPPLADGTRKLMWALYRTQTSTEATEEKSRLDAKRKAKEAENGTVAVNGTGLNDTTESAANKGEESNLTSEDTELEELRLSRRLRRFEKAKPRNLLRNEQLWNKPSGKFAKAWKRGAYLESEQFFKKQARRRMQAQDEDPSKAKAERKYSWKLNNKKKKN